MTAHARAYDERLIAFGVLGQVTREALAAGLQLKSYSGDQLTFDVVSCLNVLDRCPAPKTLLRQIRDILRPETGRLGSAHCLLTWQRLTDICACRACRACRAVGVLLLAVVLPFCPFVESGPAWSQVEPDEVLPVYSSRWENAVQDLVHKVHTHTHHTRTHTTHTHTHTTHAE
jgi:SAM-dependent methyltransferase